MSDDIVKRLRNPHYDSSKTHELACEAADEIERLRAMAEELRLERDQLRNIIDQSARIMLRLVDSARGEKKK